MAKRRVWTDDRDAVLERLWHRGDSPKAIAARLGTTVAAVSCRATVRRLPPREFGRIEWTAERIAEMKALDAAGMTLNDIAHRMGVTRGAVAGARRRLGMTQSARSPLTKRPVGRHRDGEKMAEIPMEEVISRLSGAHGPGPGVGMAELGTFQCRWPLWGDKEKPTFRCCGARTKPGAAYCTEHQARSEPSPYRWTPKREERLERLIAQGVTEPGRLANELKAPVSVVTTHAAFIEARKNRGPRSVGWGRV